MPVVMTSFLVPPNGVNVPFLLEDRYLRGGFRVVNLLTDRDAIHPLARRPGMLVHVIENDILYKLLPDNTWAEFKAGLSDVEFPIVIAGNKIGLDASQVLPTERRPGQFLANDGRFPMWVDLLTSRGVRNVAQYVCPEFIAPGDSHAFDIAMGRTVMLLEVKLNAIDIEFTAYTKPVRDDRNPYKFVSSVDFLQDDGVTNENGTLVYHRRFSFLANMADSSPLQYFKFRNLGAAPARPTLDITYIALE